MGQWFLWAYVLSIHVTVPVLTASLFHLLLRVLSNFYFVTHGIYFLTAVRTETSTTNVFLGSITTCPITSNHYQLNTAPEELQVPGYS